MIRTITQIVSQKYQQSRLKVWGKVGLAAAVLALGTAGVPVASAGCGGVGLAGSPAIPIMPMLSGPQTSEHGSAAKPSSASIVGLWNIHFSVGGTVVDEAFDAWHSDGTEVLNDFTDPINGNVCLGVWKQNGSGAYTLKHPSWYFDGSGNLLGTVIIHESVTLSADGNSFSGNAIEDVYDVAGNFLYALTAQVSAARIVAD